MKYAVITGASSGIGSSFAALYASKGYGLVLIARREKRLKVISDTLRERYGTNSIIITADLSVMDEVYKCYESVKDLDIEVFINNAGLGEAGAFKDTCLDKELFMVDVNVKSVLVFSKLMVKYFEKKGSGYLLNVASSAGLLPAGPYMAAYYASKAYVASLTRAIAAELKLSGSNVYVGCLCPGPVDTQFNEVANVEFALKGISAKYCVSYAYKMMKKKKTVIVPKLELKMAVVGGKIMPGKMMILMTARQQMKKISG